ncbi:fimbria/pilus outer membrane usher protein [Fulvimonas sp. R45]|uniref:fimbria/pilus outer membrane usher protein n=1 Tax=Fulvimonas sp. R45 TaxID=3045937 RepID=UPI00265EACF0|nr:fimbria/pilus outer membrane usher protein [Fulvimonas sp. R45]MDO1528618.1 fimbria/pilus outer membrane usher protein [Fulvimonas sp. R45]
MSRQPIHAPHALWQRPLAVLIAGALGATSFAAAAADATAAVEPAEASFNSAFLMGGTRHVDLSRFERGNPVQPGVYPVDVYVNGDRVGNEDVRFRGDGARGGAHPCFDTAQLQRYGVDTSRLAGATARQGNCRRIEQWIPDATASYDGSQLRLDLGVPQAAMRRRARGYVAPRYWDRGVTAGILGYAFNAFRMRSDAGDVTGDGRVFAPDGSTVATGAAIPAGSTLDGMAIPPGSVFGADGRVIGPDGTPLAPPVHGRRVVQDSAYLGLNAGLNIGDWQFRHDSSLTWQSGGGRHWQDIATYAQRNFPGIRSQLTVGESSTSGEIFDTVSFRGVRLASDDRMLPDSLRGYAPVVRGVAASNARVEIRQNGYLIYQTTVAPGPFEIDDLYPTGYGGDLQVTVTEADGSRHRFAVPYSSVAQLLRPGIGRYGVTVGQVRDTYLHGHPYLLQGTYQRGLTNLVTGYGGVVFSQGYGAVLAGAAFNTRAGAFALDLTHAHTQLPGQGGSAGQSLKLGYSKFLAGTGTNFSVAAYRYSTAGYLGLQDALLSRDLDRRGLGTQAIRRQRSRFELTLNQTLGGAGALYITGSLAHYWNAPGADIQYQAGYTNHVGSLSYTLSGSRTRDALGRRETRYFLNFSLPLGHEAHAPSLNGLFAHSDRGYGTSQLGVSGSAGRDDEFSYGATASDDTRSGGSGAVNAQYRSPYSTLSASYAQGSGYRQASVGANGALVVHAGGVTFSPQQGETMALVEAKGAKGARVTNYAGVRVDGNGYALVPYLIPYRYNTVQLDPEGTATDVQLQSTSQQVAPYAGAVVKVVFHTDQGRSALIEARDAHGGPLPFGADVLDEQGQDVGVVGQASRLFLRGLADRGSLRVKWGDQPGQQCRIDYALPPRDGHAYYDRLDATCRPQGDAPATSLSRPTSPP